MMRYRYMCSAYMGVIMIQDYRYSEQTRETTNKAANRMNFRLRSLTVTDMGVYEKLLNVYVPQTLTYCAPAWNALLKKDRSVYRFHIVRFRQIQAQNSSPM